MISLLAAAGGGGAGPGSSTVCATCKQIHCAADEATLQAVYVGGRNERWVILVQLAEGGKSGGGEGAVLWRSHPARPKSEMTLCQGVYLPTWGPARADRGAPGRGSWWEGSSSRWLYASLCSAPGSIRALALTEPCLTLCIFQLTNLALVLLLLLQLHLLLLRLGGLLARHVLRGGIGPAEVPKDLFRLLSARFLRLQSRREWGSRGSLLGGGREW